MALPAASRHLKAAALGCACAPREGRLAVPRWRRSRVRGAGQGRGRPSARRLLWGLGLMGPCGGGEEEEVVPGGQ